MASVVSRASSLHGLATDLISKLEGLSGPDREVGEELLRFFGWTSVDGRAVDPKGDRALTIPDLLGSVDAVMALVEEKLPGRFWAVTAPDSLRDVGLYQAEIADADMGFDCHTATGPTPAIALLIALLRALEGEGSVQVDGGGK